MPEPLSPNVIAWLLRSLPKAQVMKIITALKAGNFDLALQALNQPKALNQFNPTTPNIPTMPAPNYTPPTPNAPFITPPPGKAPAPWGWMGKGAAAAGKASGKVPVSIWKTPITAGGYGSALKSVVGGGAKAVSPWLLNPYTAAIAGGIALGNVPAVKQRTQQMWGIGDFETAYRDYQEGGGALSYNQWATAGKPKSSNVSGTSTNILDWMGGQNITPEAFTNMTTEQKQALFKNAQAAGVSQAPQAAPEENPADWEFYTPHIVRNRKTGKFFSAADRLLEIPPDIALMMYNEAFGINRLNEQRSKEQQEWGKATNEAERYKSAYNMQLGQNTIGQINAGRGDQGASQDAIRKQNEFETMREQLLGEFTAPRDWIQRWIVQNRDNPYTVRPDIRTYTAQGTAAMESDSARQESQYWRGILDRYDENPQGIGNALGLTNEGILANIADADARASSLTTQSQTYPASGSPGSAMSYYNPTGEDMERWQAEATPVRKPATPPTPDWLHAFVPGLGANISRQTVPTPSGQQLTGLPWSQAEGLAGYADWAGGRPWRDILDEAAMMQTRTPRGAGGTKWKPQTQRRGLA